ncbi:hypothetical protein [Lachnotalea sp. AF33-28]|uniref:hypothetical protein n=1 Tax=Lachnotalea sp. AF33-28 TaxID=2292046 RepID=UPI000E4DBC54|nr:hypothetical protein [Lachnotalea sp. AF33-28]RHP34544.1 hypothetical protein DWZ56_07875 [Lachnotalea sp. AF33-28]
MSIIKSFSVGDGDMFYIDHNSDNFSIIDCYMDDYNKKEITSELKSKSDNKGITRFISTHPDEDHLQGLKYLDGQMGIVNFYCVKNEATKDDETDDFKHYCALRDGEHAYYVSKGCSRKWMNIGDEERGCAGINFKWPIITNSEFKEALSAVTEGTGFNNISPIFTYSVENGIVVMWMGDMEHDFLEKIKDQVDWTKVDVLFAPHHGRESGKVPDDILKKIDPHVIVIGEAPSKYLNYYSGYNTITQNSAGDIVFDCSGDKVHVYVSKADYGYDTSFLSDEGAKNSVLGNYLGSFMPKGAV